jgi:chromosome segregation ATPase
VFAQALDASTGRSDEKFMKMESDSASLRELQPIVAATETVTQSDPADPSSEPGSLAAQLEAALAECKRLEAVKLEADAAADKRLRQVRIEYGNRLIQLEQDSAAEHQTNENLLKKIGALEQSLADQAQGMQTFKEQFAAPADALAKTKAEFENLQRSNQTLESEVTELRNTLAESRGQLMASQAAEQQRQSQISELAAKLERASAELRTLRTAAQENEAARKQFMADLEKEREANKLSRQKVDELNTALKNSQHATEQAEARVRESATRSSDLEKKAADLKKAFEDLTRNHAAEKSAGAQSVHRVKELEEQLKGANADLAASKTEVEKQNSARQRVEAENRNLAEANAKAKADLDKEREANKLSRQKAEELSTQLKNAQLAREQTEARARESATRSSDSEKKAADLKKTVEELTRNHATEKNASAQSAQHAKKLEEQLKSANADLVTSKTELEKQNSARQRLETENRTLAEANGKAKADLDKEREANKGSRQKAEELNTQLKNSQHAAEQAETRARESATRCTESEKKAADLKKTVEELTRNHAAAQSAGTQSAQRVKELEQQLKSANADLAASKTEVEKQVSARQRLEAENRTLAEANAKVQPDLAESAKNQAALEKRASELEQRVHEGISSLAKITAELQKERAERERAEKCASSAAEHLQQLNEKVNRKLESERASRAQIAELEKTIHDRGDALARASAALRKETKERQMAEKQLRLVSEIGTRLESNLTSLEDAKKSFEISLNQKDERLQTVERSLAQASSALEKESTERRRLAELLGEVQRQLEKQTGDSKVEISRLRAALELGELQRKRLEGGLLRSREIATNARDGQSVMLDSLRRELRQPVEDLRLSACRLLESQVTDEQKRAIETLLEKALFLQVTLNAVAQPDSESPSPATARRVDSQGKKNGAK